jgi:hypothetical protein
VACVLSQGPFQRVTGLIVFSFVDSFKFNIDIEQTGATKGLDCTLRTQPDLSHQSKFWTKYPKLVPYGGQHAPQNLPLIGGSVKILEKKVPK